MTYSSEKFVLKWNDFQQNIASSYKELRTDSDFCDVTLVSEEDVHIEAHRIILAASSPFFNGVLKMNKYSHPMIYMRGLKARDLVAIVDFIYHGEANVDQDDLDGFLALADELQLKGLACSKPEIEEPVRKSSTKMPKRIDVLKQEHVSNSTSIVEESHEILVSDLTENKSIVLKSDVHNKLSLDRESEELKSMIDSRMERITDQDYTFKCNVCGKTGSHKTVMSRHVETHIEGLCYPCSLCGKVSRSSNSLNKHVSKYHNNK